MTWPFNISITKLRISQNINTYVLTNRLLNKSLVATQLAFARHIFTKQNTPTTMQRISSAFMTVKVVGSSTKRINGLPTIWQAYATTSNATIRTCKVFKVSSLYASLFWWVTNQRDTRLSVLVVSFDLVKGLVTNTACGSFSGMAGFASRARLDFVCQKRSKYDSLIPRTTKSQWMSELLSVSRTFEHYIPPSML